MKRANNKKATEGKGRGMKEFLILTLALMLGANPHRLAIR
jgi:hypothetical protein